MSEKVMWLLAFLALYWTFCVYWGLRGALEARSASDYFMAGRRLPAVTVILGVPCALVAGWTFYGFPVGVGAQGFPYAYIALFPVAAAMAMAVFQKRQWMLGKRFGYLTAGEMLGDYFQSVTIPPLTVFVTLLFSVGFLGLLFWISGYLLTSLTEGYFSLNGGMWTAAGVLFLYVALGGLRAAAFAGILQFGLYVFGVVAIGIIALDAAGGWVHLNSALASLAADTGGAATAKGWGGEYNARFALDSVAHAVASGDSFGAAWTGVMSLAFVLALIGIPLSPVFTASTFGSRDEKPFQLQLGVILAFLIGLLLLIFGMFQGLSMLTANPATGGATPVVAVPGVLALRPDALVLAYLDAVADSAPWLFGLLAVCGLAAMQATAAVFLSSGGTVLTRDVYMRLFVPAAGPVRQQIVGRVSILIVVLAALGLASFGTAALPVFVGFAVACSLQILPSLAAICWIPRITGTGAAAGFAAGLMAVFLTDALGTDVANTLGAGLPWPVFPLTIHSAGWGIAVNVAVCVLVSALTRSRAASDRRAIYHEFLQQHAGLPTNKRRYVPVAWILALCWVIFAIGPGAVVGNDIFGSPGRGPAGWIFGIPSIWAWQILSWLLGVVLVWFLTSKMELSTPAKQPVVALVEDWADQRGPVRR